MPVIIRIPKADAVATIAKLTRIGFAHDVEFGFIPEETKGTIIIRGSLPPAAYPAAEAIDGITVFNDSAGEPLN